MYIYLLTYCELKLLHDHSNILHIAQCTLRLSYVDNFNFTSCRVEFKLAILVYKALHGLAPRCTSPTTVCWWLKSVDVMSAIS